MDVANVMQQLGLELPSPAYLVGAILFGLVGMATWAYGKKMQRPTTKWLGLALMLYPYVITSTWLMYLVGAGLCVAVVVDRS